MYLVCYEDGIKQCETEKEVNSLLLKACMIWTTSDEYDDELDYKELYSMCLKEKDFGDIATVYKCDCYFTAGKTKVPCELEIAAMNVPFAMTRIM